MVFRLKKKNCCRILLVLFLAIFMDPQLLLHIYPVGITWSQLFEGPSCPNYILFVCLFPAFITFIKTQGDKHN